MLKPKFLAIVSGFAIAGGAVVGALSQAVPAAPPVTKPAPQPTLVAPSGRSMVSDSPQSTARQVAPNGPTWADIPMDQFGRVTDPMPSIILPPPSNPGPRTRAPWWNYHYVMHTDGKTWHVEPTLDINGNPIPIYWPE